MEWIKDVIGWATSTDWGTVTIAVIAMIGALDIFLLALLKVSNLLFPNIRWDDNVIEFIHGWLSKIGKK